MFNKAMNFMKKTAKKVASSERLKTMALMLLVGTGVAMAQNSAGDYSAGTTALTTVTQEIAKYVPIVVKLCYAIAGVVAVVGAISVYIAMAVSKSFVIWAERYLQNKHFGKHQECNTRCLIDKVTRFEDEHKHPMNIDSMTADDLRAFADFLSSDYDISMNTIVTNMTMMPRMLLSVVRLNSGS